MEREKKKMAMERERQAEMVEAGPIPSFSAKMCIETHLLMR